MNTIARRTLPLLLVAVPALAFAGPKADGKSKAAKAEAAQQKFQSEYFDKYKKPSTLEVPKHRLEQPREQPTGLTVTVPLRPIQIIPKDAKAFYIEGRLMQIEDGGLHIQFDVTGKGGTKSKAMRWYRLGNLKKTPLLTLKSKLGQTVRLELKSDANGVPFVLNVLPPRL